VLLYKAALLVTLIELLIHQYCIVIEPHHIIISRYKLTHWLNQTFHGLQI